VLTGGMRMAGRAGSLTEMGIGMILGVAGCMCLESYDRQRFAKEPLPLLAVPVLGIVGGLMGLRSMKERQPMGVNDRAVQIWSTLALAAYNRQVLTYNMIAKLTGISRVGLANCLEAIQSYCLFHDLPPLAVLVVGEKTGMPGVGFIAAQDVPKAQDEVFQFDWLAHGSPSLEKFEAAVRVHPSTGMIQVPDE
jgi:hypothetical protein